MTPYAIAHLRLLEIHRRWKGLRQRPDTYHYAWRSAGITGFQALSSIQEDQEWFDYEVHGIDPFDPSKPRT